MMAWLGFGFFAGRRPSGEAPPTPPTCTILVAPDVQQPTSYVCSGTAEYSDTVDVELAGYTTATGVPVVAGAWEATLTYSEEAPGTQTLTVTPYLGAVPGTPDTDSVTVTGSPSCEIVVAAANALLPIPTVVSGTAANATHVRVVLDGYATQAVPVTAGAWTCTLVYDTATTQGSKTLTCTPISGALEGTSDTAAVMIYVADEWHVGDAGVSSAGGQISTWAGQRGVWSFTAAANYPDLVVDDTYYQGHDTVDTIGSGLAEAFVADGMAVALSGSSAASIVMAGAIADRRVVSYSVSLDSTDCTILRTATPGELKWMVGASVNYVTAPTVDANPHVLGFSYAGSDAAPKAKIYCDGTYVSGAETGTIPAAIPAMTAGFVGRNAAGNYLSQRLAGIWTWTSTRLTASDHAAIAPLVEAYCLETMWWESLAVQPDNVIDPEWGLRTTDGTQVNAVPLILSGGVITEASVYPDRVVDSLFGGHVTIDGDGTERMDSDALSVLFSGATALTIFIVGGVYNTASRYLLDSTSQYLTIDSTATQLNFRIGGTANYVTGGYANTENRVYAFRYAGADAAPRARIYRNGTLISGAEIGTIPASIGTITSGGLWGTTAGSAISTARIACILVYLSALTPEQIASISSSLQARYGL